MFINRMLKQTLNKSARSLSFVLESRWSRGVFVSLLFLGVIVSILFHKAPVLVIFAFAAWTLFSAVTVLLEASVDLLNRKLFAAVFGFLWCLFLGGLSYLGWKLLVREAF